jgi:hypothetical protein
VTVVVEQSTWDKWETERRSAARIARSASAGESAAEVFLYALRSWKDNAYRACPDVGSWIADCPACGCERTLVISEPRDRAPIALWCRTGCSKEAVIGALAAWRNASARDAELEWMAKRIEDLETCVDRLCEHIASEALS